MTFVRTNEGTQRSFDSSPEYSLSKAFGWPMTTIRLETINETQDVVSFAVFAKASSQDDKESRVGTLFQKTRAAIWRAMK